MPEHFAESETSSVDATILGWFVEHGDEMYRFALRRVGLESLAEDLVQETFLAAIQSASRVNGSGAAVHDGPLDEDSEHLSMESEPPASGAVVSEAPVPKDVSEVRSSKETGCSPGAGPDEGPDSDRGQENRGIENSRAFLLTILRRKISDHFRREFRRDEVESSHRDVAMAVHWQDPSENLCHDELREALKGCIEAMPVAMRRAFELRVVRSLDVEETAEMLGVTRGVLAARLYRSRLAVRDCLSVFFQ
ncbi:MAG: sigma factor [Planctomycetota bacterium]